MAGRIRTIKPEILEDEIAADLSDEAWRLWVSLWVLADDYANVRMGNRYLAANVWQNTDRDVTGAVNELVDKGFVEAYAVNGQRYGHISGFLKHQRVDNSGKPRVPGPECDDGTWDQIVSGNLAAENAMPDPPSSSNISRGSRVVRARIPAAGPPTSDPRPTTPTTEGPGADAPGARRTRRLKTGLPSDFTVSPAVETMCRSQDLPNPHVVFLDFCDKALANDYRYADWERAFAAWMRSPITRRDYQPWSRTPAAIPVETPEQAEARAAANWERDKVRYGIVDVPVSGVVDVGELFADLGAAKRIGGQDASGADSVRPQRSEETEPVKRNVAQVAAK